MMGKKTKYVPRKSDNFVSNVAPIVTKHEVISVSAAEANRSSASGNRVRQTADRLRDMPEWLEEFTEGFVNRNSKSSGSEREHPPETPLFLSLYPPTEQEQHKIFSLIF